MHAAKVLIVSVLLALVSGCASSNEHKIRLPKEPVKLGYAN